MPDDNCRVRTFTPLVHTLRRGRSYTTCGRKSLTTTIIGCSGTHAQFRQLVTFPLALRKV
eukprot:144323-Prymnesium_polylepis.1